MAWDRFHRKTRNSPVREQKQTGDRFVEGLDTERLSVRKFFHEELVRRPIFLGAGLLDLVTNPKAPLPAEACERRTASDIAGLL